jgi:hypothetical protein
MTADTWDGFLPAHDCKVCGTALQGQGSGRPAELYAGTYTGLCYTCERSAEFKLSDNADGSETWSFPPACPSWRRTRETYTCFPGHGCAHGSRWVSRADAQGGSYRVSCETCMSLLCWRDSLKVARQARREAAEAYFAKLHNEAEKCRKQQKLSPSVASENMLTSDVGIRYRRALREVWSLPPDAWSFL